MTVLAAPPVPPAEQNTEHPHIVRVNDVPMVRESRIPVRLIAQMYRAGDTVDDILQAYAHLSAAVVHDAISYYLDHRAEMEQEIAAHRIEPLLEKHNATMDGQGQITFVAKP